jgi:hypothetical protein
MSFKPRGLKPKANNDSNSTKQSAPQVEDGRSTAVSSPAAAEGNGILKKTNADFRSFFPS